VKAGKLQLVADFKRFQPSQTKYFGGTRAKKKV
jgi:hypothetical protein